jgi:hypothetical protein
MKSPLSISPYFIIDQKENSFITYESISNVQIALPVASQLFHYLIQLLFIPAAFWFFIRQKGKKKVEAPSGPARKSEKP